MEKQGQQSAKSSCLAEELLRVKGIGQATAQALNQIGIFRLSDLAVFNSEDLANSLKAIIPGITPQRITREDWIGQAIALAKGENHAPETARRAVMQLGERRSPQEEDWYELSDFFISFGYTISRSAEKTLQTKVDHSQTGQSARWDGVAKAELLDWLLSHANLPEPENDVETTAPVPERPISPVDSAIELSEQHLPLFRKRHCGWIAASQPIQPKSPQPTS